MAFVSGSSTPFGIFDDDPQFQSDADKIVDFVRKKLGDPVLCTHLSSSQIYACFEEAALEFSAITNQYQAKSVLTQFLGAPTGSLAGSEQTYPARLLEFQKKMAEPYGEEAGLNGPHPLHSASIDLQVGVQSYDLQSLLSGVLPGLTGTAAGSRIRVKDVFHFSPLAAFRFFGTTSAVNYLHNQFNFESFTPETIFYLLPIWEDVLRGMQFETSQRVRRSQHSFELHNNVLKIYPMPSENIRLHFTFTLPPDPTQPAPGEDSSTYHGVANLANVPFGNIRYGNVNSIGKQWIRRLAFALCKEVEGIIRSKYATIPIPNSDVTLNGPELINDARADIETLRNELKEILDDLTYEKLAQREQELMEATKATMMEIPMRIYVGSALPFVIAVAEILR